MTLFRTLLVFPAALAFSSCSSLTGGNDSNYDTGGASTGYDTGNSYAVPGGGTDGGYSASSSSDSDNAVYGQAAYEEPAATTPAPSPAPAANPRPSPAPSGAATVHTVVKGDSLWAISRKYKVSVDAIKAANNMTKDTVVLGSKLNIPAR